MQTNPIYLSSGEASKTQNHMPDRDLTNDRNSRRLYQVLIHPNNPTDTIQVTIPSVDLDMHKLSHSATTESQHNKSIHNVSPVSDDIFFQSGPHPTELKQLPIKDSPDSPTPSKRGPTQLFKAYDLPNTTALYNHPEPRQTNAVAQKLQQLALQAHSKVQKQTRGCIMCGKTYAQVLEEATAEYLPKRAFIVGLKSGVMPFIPRRVSQATACDGVVHCIGNGVSARGRLLPLIQE